MARSRPDSRGGAAERIGRALRRHKTGLHRLEAPVPVVATDLPQPLAEVYRICDGGHFFHDTIALRPSAAVCREPLPPGPADVPGHLAGAGLRWIGEHSGDDLYVDRRGQVYRREGDTGDWLAEGSRFDCWLWGAIEAEALLYDDDGEFRGGVFDDFGEVTPEMAAVMCRRILARDRRAPAPRWRLARALTQIGQIESARDQLEQVVAGRPDFSWAWFDLAQISEKLGDGEAACDEMCAAAEALPEYEHAGFLWAHAARLASAAGDEGRRAEYAGKALARAPDLARAQRQGAAATLAHGDTGAALVLAELAAALVPRDVEVIDLLARIRAALKDQGSDAD